MANPYELAADDAEFLARAGSVPVLLPGDLRDVTGEPQTDFAGTLRVAFLGWVAKVARDTGATIRIAYLHERGDWPYELVTWTLGAKQHLHLMSFDGGSDVVWEAQLER